METTEQFNDGIKPFIYLLFTDTLKSFFELIVTISSYVVRCILTLIHEVLEGNISVFLKADIVLKWFLNHLIHFLLQSQ